MRFSGKKVVVTGASRGIGRAIAQAFKAEGAWVIGTRTGNANKMDDVCKEWVAADLFAGARMGAQRATLGVRNVANRWYRQPLASLPDPGFSVVGQLSTDF